MMSDFEKLTVAREYIKVLKKEIAAGTGPLKMKIAMLENEIEVLNHKIVNLKINLRRKQ